MEQNARSLHRLGFRRITDVTGRSSIADLYPPSKRRPGVYLLRFANDDYYIGQAVEPVRRFAQHRIASGGIVGHSFIPCRKSDLDIAEKTLIARASRAGIPLRNNLHASDTTCEQDLDDIIPRAEQLRWLAQGFSTYEPLPVVLGPQAPERRRTDARFQKLKQDPRYDDMLACLQRYVHVAVPSPRSTQLSFWSLSCLPATGSGHRFAVVNAAMMEMLVLGRGPANSGETWGFVNVSRSILVNDHGSMTAVRASMPNTKIATDRRYRDGGEDQVSLHAPSIAALVKMIERRDVASAARNLMLRVMRKRPTIYAKFHAPALADAVMRS